MQNELRLDLILETLATLRNRISERFPDSGLSKVAHQLYDIGEETGPILERIRKPNHLVRAGIGFALGAIGVLVFILIKIILLKLFANGQQDITNIGAFLQTVESAAQDVIFLSVAIWFLFTVEMRLNRRTSLQALRRLRNIVHIVDMHQLTKDPEPLRTPGMATPSSPRRELTPFELARYLDYCSELLSLCSKLAALHVQFVNDPVVLDAVNDIEVLAANLSNLMWQKIVILDTGAKA